ncbi:MAG: Ig-like domain-containing protein [Bacteroidota bacterium]|nr:Ig-like domain-containing protein [Bacteroidota bacterium]
MKSMNLVLCFIFTFLFLSCKEGPQELSQDYRDDPTNPSIQPKVIWVWIDSPRPYGRWNMLPGKQNDSLPVGYRPGRLLISFNKIMVSYSVIPNVTISSTENDYPQLSTYGAYSADGQTFEWPIYGNFKVAKQYLIIVDKSVRDVTNLNLSEDYKKVLIPEPKLRLIESEPKNGDSAYYNPTIVRFEFNSEIDSNSLKSSVTISPSVLGRWQFDYFPNRFVAFVPQNGFKASTWYEITFTKSLKDIFNNVLPNEIKIKFKTRPFRIYYNSPYGGQINVDRSTPISCGFSLPIDTSTVRQSFTISPAVSGYFSYYYNSFSFYRDQLYAPNTTYTVTISTSLRSKTQDQLQNPYTFSFTTRSD